MPRGELREAQPMLEDFQVFDNYEKVDLKNKCQFEVCIGGASLTSVAIICVEAEFSLCARVRDLDLGSSDK